MCSHSSISFLPVSLTVFSQSFLLSALLSHLHSICSSAQVYPISNQCLQVTQSPLLPAGSPSFVTSSLLLFCCTSLVETFCLCSFYFFVQACGLGSFTHHHMTPWNFIFFIFQIKLLSFFYIGFEYSRSNKTHLFWTCPLSVF